MKLIFKYTECSEPYCFEYVVPFEYESKEKFIFDVLENPIMLDKMGIISVSEYEIEEKTIFDKEYVKNLDEYVFTLEDWFENNKV